MTHPLQVAARWLIALACLCAPLMAPAHPVVKTQTDPAVSAAVLDVYHAIAAAVQAKDAARIKGFYTDDFTHTHGSGKLDERDARVVSLLTGEPTVEMADDHELVILGYGGQTAIVRGKGLILNVKEQQLYQFRWVQTFVKTPAGWKLAASQATRLPDPPIPKK
ncbi:DUF4440 domain-containing protein [Ottowia sp.]|jgi:ketosteroid isomerase-like protein|uniref:DUF4440 domain-containing protein n=1 Tax=Ottowia sp. TaxID=1898956 RepID=UPI0025EA1494|nr:DUF4440 domain-containing protein [Ottowia sp.]MBK6615573.1 DUF4440 domain-containing protein [Ottowia sp.]MBK6746642.1 DUF4440 domain-containing protein [Ottowia sp.]